MQREREKYNIIHLFPVDFTSGPAGLFVNSLLETTILSIAFTKNFILRKFDEKL